MSIQREWGCSRCGNRGLRQGEGFTCPACGLALDADLNAALNIVQHPLSLPTTRGKGGRYRPLIKLFLLNRNVQVCLTLK